MSLDLTAITISMSNLVLKTLWEKGLNMFEQLDGNAKHLLFEASGHYVENYTKRHGIFKVLEMTKPMDLEQVYTATQLLESPRLKSLETLAQLEELYRDLYKRSLDFSHIPKHDGLQVANENQYLAVLGGPGAGKSTFLRKLGLEALKGDAGLLANRYIPVLLELKQLNLSELNLLNAITLEFETCGFPSPQTFVEKALEKGHLLLLLDGLDEVPLCSRNLLMEAIQNFVDRYHKNRFVLSCRTPAYMHSLRQFVDFEVADFDNLQIEEFIHNWFSSELDQLSGTADKLLHLLQHPDNTSTRELAKTPLLLVFICLVYDRDLSLPDNRGLLFGKALDILLRQWSAQRRIERDLIYQGLYPELEKLLLSEIAYWGIASDQLFLSERNVVKQIQTFLSETLDAPAYLDAGAILNAIEEQQGILVKQAEGVFSFSHLTLQEYLAARYIALDHRRVKKLVINHLSDPRWHEIFLLVAGLSTTGDELLIHIEEYSRKYIDTPRLCALLRWVDDITTDSQGEPGSLTQRIFAILIALSLNQDQTLARALTLLRALACTHECNLVGKFDQLQTDAHRLAGDYNLALPDLMHVLAHKLREADCFDKVDLTLLAAKSDALRLRLKDKELAQAASVLHQLWLDVFHLKPELLQLSKAEITNLELYLNANLLILQCKKAAVRVLRATWEQLQGYMLRHCGSGLQRVDL